MNKCDKKYRDCLKNKHLAPLISLIPRSEYIYISNKINEEYNLGTGQFSILRKLAGLNDEYKVNQEFFAKHFRIDKASIARSIKKLEENNLITRERDPENKRQYIIKLTDDGREIADKITKYEEDWEEKIYERYSGDKEELLQHIRLMAEQALELIYESE